MPTIPVQTRLAPPSPGNAALPLGPNLPPATPAAASGPIGHWSLVPGHSAAPPAAAGDLRIDSLVLHGFSPAEGRRASVAFEQELARLLTEIPLSASGLASGTTPDSATPSIGHWSLVMSGQHSASARGHSRALGAGAARALHTRLRA